ELPALFGQDRVQHRHRDQRVQLLQLAGNQCARGPWTDQRHIKTIAPGLGLKPRLARWTGRAVGGDPMADRRLLPHETALVVLVLNRVPVTLPFTIYQHALPFPVTPSAATGSVTRCDLTPASWTVSAHRHHRPKRPRRP